MSEPFFTQAVWKRESVNKKGEDIGPLILIDEETRDQALASADDPLAKLGFVAMDEEPVWLLRIDGWLTEDEAADAARAYGVTCLDVD